MKFISVYLAAIALICLAVLPADANRGSGRAFDPGTTGGPSTSTATGTR